MPGSRASINYPPPAKEDEVRLSANRICLIALTLAATVAASATAAQRGDDSAPRPLYRIDKAAPRSLPEPLVFDAAEELLIQVDPRVVAGNPRAFLIDLPGQPMLEAVRTRFDVYQADWKSWFGTLRPVDDEAGPTGYIYLGFHGDRLTGDMKIAGERYRIVGGPEVGQRLVRLDDTLTPPSCGLGSAADTPADDAQPWLTPEQAPEVGSWEDSWEKDPVSTRTVDVLFVYPGRTSTRNGALPAFFQLSANEETDARNFAQDSIATANAIFTNSVVDARYGFLGMVPLIDPVERGTEPATGIFDTLAWLTGGPGGSPARGAEAAALRDAYGADIVAAIVPAGWGEDPYCGVANLPENGSFGSALGTYNEDMGDRAFSATRSGCGALDFTVPHEIGHNHGLRHDRPATTATDLFPNGRGYVFQDGGGVWRSTVMGCACRGTYGSETLLPYPICSGSIFGAVCNRVPYYSNPGITHPTYGVPLGDATHQEAQAILNRVFTTERYRTRATLAPPYARMTVSCSGLSCTFSASGSTDDTYIADYFWDFGDGGTARGFSVTRTYNNAGSRRIHLVVTDSQGQRTMTTGTASPWNPAYEGYVDQINCRTINGWAYDAVVPNTSINVDVYRNGAKTATVPANIYRQDLVNAGKGNGYHGFNYTPSSSWRNGQWQTAGVRFPNTSTDLTYAAERTIICNVSMFTGITPADNLSTGGIVYSVATQFSSSKSGLITQIGFHRASGETGSNTLHLTTDGGAELASKTASCSSSGWCWVNLNQAVAINAGTRYRVWVNTNTQQSKTGCGIGGGLSNGSLTAHSGYWVAGDTFPTNGSCSNFFVDVKFEM
jgi:hypothetical protein